MRKIQSLQRHRGSIMLYSLLCYIDPKSAFLILARKNYLVRPIGCVSNGRDHCMPELPAREEGRLKRDAMRRQDVVKG